ncbi:hypothetical protein ACIN8IBEIGE_210027 [Acinetobacter sp. 8I-beige]|nr:hypothetical protein ACIN8IBEIGE_210027 [Acinetobacter sp. 8I-beige]
MENGFGFFSQKKNNIKKSSSELITGRLRKNLFRSKNLESFK